MSYYEELGVDRGASHEQLRRAYRSRARQLHPDVRPPDASDEAEEALRRLTEAWSVLGDPERRRRYDATLGPMSGAPGMGGDPAFHPDGVHPDAVHPDAVHPELRPRPRARLWMVLVAIMVVIFVITAYAGPPPR